MELFEAAFQMLGSLKLAIKYQVDGLRNDIVEQLSSGWPRHLSEWDEMDVRLGKNCPMSPDTPSIIRLARDGDIPELLPLSFYMLSRSFSNDVQGWEATPPSATGVQSSHKLFLLDRDDMATLAFGQGGMARWISSRTGSKFREWVCPNRLIPCQDRVRVRWAEIQNDILHSMDILTVLQMYASGKSPAGTSLCVACQTLFVQALLGIRNDFFDELPKIFGLVKPEGIQ